MARTRFASLLEEWECDFSKVTYQGQDVSDSNNNSSPDNIRPHERSAKKKNPPICHEVCACGNIVDIIKLACDFCGRQKIPKTVNWESLKQKAPKSSDLATRRFFKQMCQLYAAHNRDIVVLMHNRNGSDHHFKVWGTPTSGQYFLMGELGCAIRDAWRSQFIQERTVGVDRVEPSVDGVTTVSTSDDPEDESLNNFASINSDDGDVYVVERVLGMRISEVDGKPRYHIKWLGYPDDVNTWEPEENIIDKSLLEPFL